MRIMDIETFSSDLKLAEDGVWYGPEFQHVSYPDNGHDDCFSVEDSSFWFNHRNDCIVALVDSFPPQNNEPIFDIGGGNGFVSSGLQHSGFNVVLMEPGALGAANAKKRGLKNVICATTETANIKKQSLAAVGLFDVIEHIGDDIAFLKSINRLLKDGGYLYTTVPAYSFLWSQEDVLAGHFRRYNIREISRILVSAGFSIAFASYIFRPLPIPIYLLRTIPYRLGIPNKVNVTKNIQRDHVVNAGYKKNLMNVMLKAEVHNIRKQNSMRFGGSCLIAAIKNRS